MILKILGLAMVVAGILGTYGLVTYRPYMSHDSWGDPDAGEACGWACLILLGVMGTLTMTVLGLGLVMH